MAKKISPLSKDLNKFNEKINHEVASRFGNKYTVEIHKYFKKTDIQKLAIDYIALKEELPNYVTDLELIKNSTLLFPILLIKYFTNVSMPDSLPEMIAMASGLIDIEVFDKIIGALPIEEIKRVNDLVKEMTDNLPKVLAANQMLGVEENGIQ